MKRLLIVGDPSPTHLGGAFLEAAHTLGLEARVQDVRGASSPNRLRRAFDWRFRGRRPSRLAEFAEATAAACEKERPRWLFATGFTPLTPAALERIRAAGTRLFIFLSDDPWNRALCGRWFFAALPRYDVVFTPRRANEAQLKRAGCRRVERLAFGYSPSLYFREASRAEDAPDLVFAGGADRDRMPFAEAAIRAGLRVALYGGYWDRSATTRAYARGFAGPAELRRAYGSAKAALCLVRRANRDGHVMRSYELPASGACVLAEDTPDHRELFGDEGTGALYFREPAEMAEKARRLAKDASLGERLAGEAHRRVTAGRNTYADRLAQALAAGDRS